jgi:hypothetical protein
VSGRTTRTVTRSRNSGRVPDSREPITQDATPEPGAEENRLAKQAEAAELEEHELHRMVEERAQDLLDEAQAERDEVRQDHISRMHDSVRETVASFAEQQRWEHQTTEAVLEVFEESFEARERIREEVMAGELDHAEARESYLSLHEEDEELLVEVLGERGFEALREELDEIERPGPPR